MFNFKPLMRYIPMAVIILALFGLLVFLYHTANQAGGSKTVIKYQQAQGEINAKESDRALAAEQLHTVIITEPDIDTSARVQQYWESKDGGVESESNEAESLQNNEGVEDTSLRQYPRAEEETSSDMQQETLLQRAITELLPDEDVGCKNPEVIRNAEGLIVEYNCS